MTKTKKVACEDCGRKTKNLSGQCDKCWLAGMLRGWPLAEAARKDVRS